MSTVEPRDDEETLRINRGLTDSNQDKPTDLECSNEQCMVATLPDGTLSFGAGTLSAYGIWDYPCEACARIYEAKYPEVKVWPEKYIEPIKAYKDPNCLRLGYGNNVPLDAFQKVYGKALLGILHITSRDLNPYIPRDKDEPFDYENYGHICAECRQFHKSRYMSDISVGGNRYIHIHMCRGCLKKYQDATYEIPNKWYRA